MTVVAVGLSKGLGDADFGTTEAPAGGAALLVGTGVLALVTGLLPSPKRTNVSIDLSRFSFSPRRTISFRRSLLKPISRSAAILASNDAVVTSATGAPRPDVLRRGGDDDRCEVGEADALDLDPNRRFEVEEADRRPSPKNLPDFGGSGGGDPSGE